MGSFVHSLLFSALPVSDLSYIPTYINLVPPQHPRKDFVSYRTADFLLRKKGEKNINPKSAGQYYAVPFFFFFFFFLVPLVVYFSDLFDVFSFFFSPSGYCIITNEEMGTDARWI